MRGAVGRAHKDMRSAIVLILTKNDEALSGQWMERIPDGDLFGRNQGLWRPSDTGGERAPQQSTR